MKTQTYPGLDYSGGRSNVDSFTGIHYGVISCNSVNPDALDSIMQDGEDVAYTESLAEYLNTARDEWTAANPDDADEFDEDSASQDFSDGYEGNGLRDYAYEQDGYRLTGCLDNDLFVILSPYYTFAQFCSPCVPGAGNLDNFCADGPKTYCLGHDWFDGGKAPYPVYSVKTGELFAVSV